MARCENCIHEKVCIALIKDGLPWNDGAYPAEAFCMAFQNKADVAPRAELDRVERELERVEALYFAKDTQLENAKAEVAREILDELEEVLCGEYFTERFWFDLGKLRIKYIKGQK